MFGLNTLRVTVICVGDLGLLYSPRPLGYSNGKGMSGLKSRDGGPDLLSSPHILN